MEFNAKKLAKSLQKSCNEEAPFDDRPNKIVLCFREI